MVKIASATHLQNGANGAILPSSWGTLYELQRLTIFKFVPLVRICLNQQKNDTVCRLSREVWASRIREAYGQTVEAVFQVGRELLQAKQELPHGEFMAMVERELPFSISSAERFLAIAKSPNFNNLHTVQNLPNSWGTLYQLQRLDQNTFDEAVKAGKIHPEMTRAEAEGRCCLHGKSETVFRF